MPTSISSSERDLVHSARTAAEQSYSPYSGFRVGAALRCADGSIFYGTNVENRSYGLTICAERSAVFAAIAAGRHDFECIAIYSPDSPHPLPPCGACRQVLSEFAGPDFRLILCASDFNFDGNDARGGSAGQDSTPAVMTKTMAELLPLDSLHELRE